MPINIVKSFVKGFTLIELMVVVAIIGVLASVMLGYLGDARKKGNDTSVKSNLDTVRSQAGIFYLDNNNSYLPASGSAFSLATCPVYNALGTNMLSRDKTIAEAIAKAVSVGGDSSCYNDSNVWSVSVGLKLIPNTSWCVDSGGGAKLEMTPASGSINTSTFFCN
jgi:prepilin-type N-terminal cleavage/methylation domain-containing protein